MPYFEERYSDLRWPIAEYGSAGLRVPQLGALWAIGAHFTRRFDPALVTMPTGSGKTAVLLASCFLLRARRALVLTPSRLVREQIVGEFESLEVLKHTGALGQDVPAPSVHSLEGRVGTAEEWEELRQYDVVVATPQSSSPEMTGVAELPHDLFDVMLVDEAHHSAAPSWQGLLRRLPLAKKILFTATPFRRDQREIVGTFVYVYELRDALRDGVFGQLEYRGVEPATGEDPDAAIARAAAQTLRDDQEQGLAHLLMVRTGTRNRAKELADLYARETDLRLRLVTGAHSLRHLRSVVGKLRRGELDGVICVDMLGEGFDLPRLKVAALHSPHRSLAVTLQFVGRFARTNAPDLGRAAFFALASDMDVEREKLYEQGAAWQDLIPNLSAARVQEEAQTREVLDSFVADPSSSPDAPDLSLYSLKPYHHVKILDAGPDLDITQDISFPSGHQIEHRYMSREQSVAVYVTRLAQRPDWVTADRFHQVRFDLFVIYHHAASGLLFICSTDRTPSMYERLATEYAGTGGPPLRGLSLGRLNRVLLELERTRFHNLGLRNSVAANRTESYRTLTGSDVVQGVVRNDGRSFRRGHWYGSAIEHDRPITLGLSSASKVWSNTSSRIPSLVAWCRRLASKIASERTPRTYGGLDHFDTGQEATRLPSEVVYANWHRVFYERPLRVAYSLGDGSVWRGQLLDLDLSVERNRCDDDRIGLVVSGEDWAYRMDFTLHGERFLVSAASNASEILCESPYAGMPLLTYLNQFPPTLYTADFGELAEGTTYYPPMRAEAPPFDEQRIEAFDWSSVGVDIRNEVGEPTTEGISIHDYLGQELVSSDSQIVFYDHGKGELADFVTITASEDEIRATLYHCKKSGGPTAGDRVEDAYEVCGQGVKSTSWAERRRISEQIARRWRSREGESRFLKGDLEEVENLLGTPSYAGFVLEIVLVQPGFSRRELTPKIGSLLAATDGFVFGGNCARLRVIGSH